MSTPGKTDEDKAEDGEEREERARGAGWEIGGRKHDFGGRVQ